jgi:lipopolysaccharide export system permease protein
MEYSKIKRYKRLLRISRSLRLHFAWLFVCMAWLQPKLAWARRKLGFLRIISPNRYLKILDWYIIKKFIGTYIYSILLIISISIVFDINENLAKFSQYHAPLKAIVFDYYANFVPYYANLFSPLFVFIAVIFFTSKLSRQLGDYLNACVWCILQTAYEALHVFLYTHLLPVILSQCIRDTSWHRH